MKLARLLVAMLVLVLATPVLARDVTFTGTVSYGERMVLPADAVLVVTMVLVPSRQRVTGAMARLGAKAGSPIQFSLDIRSDVLDEDHQFGLVAEIRSGGQLLFTNAEPVMVDRNQPGGNAIAVQFTPQPPPAPLPETPDPLLDVVWSVTGLDGDPVLAGSMLTLSITADHRAGGKGGCNNYFTEASFETMPLSFGPVAATRMACSPTVMAQEARFFAALASVVDYRIAGTELSLLDAGGRAVARLTRSP